MLGIGAEYESSNNELDPFRPEKFIGAENNTCYIFHYLPINKPPVNSREIDNDIQMMYSKKV